MKKVCGFECPHCGRFHKDSYDAGNCCEPEAVERFVCGSCGEEFEDEDKANEHELTCKAPGCSSCRHSDPDKRRYMPCPDYNFAPFHGPCEHYTSYYA